VLGITDFWTDVLGAAAIVLLPRPNSIFVLSVGARHGVRSGNQAAAGVFLGDTVLVTLSAAGVASLMRPIRHCSWSSNGWGWVGALFVGFGVKLATASIS
jgi:leucine efflux protein